jgi:alanine racemase
MRASDRRWAWAEIDLDAVARNVATLRAMTSPGTLFMAVVKADGYGHGALEVARAAIGAGADRVGVATLAEALRLRAGGLTAPIHLLSEASPRAAARIVDAGIVATLFSSEFAAALSRAAAEQQRQARFHLKVDTGMNRIGVCAEDAADFVESLRGLPGIVMEGVFTHFATADVPGDWEFDRQLEQFDAAIAEFRHRGIDPGIVHAANSAATILHPETHFDMVRCGIALYGLHPDSVTHGRVALEPAMSVKARVTRVTRLGMGEGVSYGMTWHAAAPTTVATIPLGYADGIRRSLSNSMRVLIGGRPCRQIGRICMDQLMVEVPRGVEVSAGDEAVLVGRQGGEDLSIEGMAELAGTIDYEIACALGARLERVYRSAPQPVHSPAE